MIEAWRKERANTKCKFYKLTKVTEFAALLKEVPMGWKDAVLPEPLTKNHNVSGLTHEENTRKPHNDILCLLGTLALHLHGNGSLEEKTSKNITLFSEKVGGSIQASFQASCMNDIPIIGDLVQVNIFLYDIDFVDVALIRELPQKKVLANIPTLFSYYVTTVTFVMSLISMYSSKLFAAHRVIIFPTGHQFWSVI